MLAPSPARADTAAMNDRRALVGPLVPLALIVVVVAVLMNGSPVALPLGPAGSDGARYESARSLPAPAALRFDGSIAPADRAVVRRVIAEARPEARRLVELVAGLVTISVGTPGAGTAGSAGPTADGYSVVLDLGGVYRTMGMRGLRRLVLHELAHVVDHALVPSALEAQLDAATPPGIGCDGGLSGGCAAREERFAESFAKWATGDIGNDLFLGYRVPPPTSLSGWGAPLAALTR